MTTLASPEDGMREPVARGNRTLAKELCIQVQIVYAAAVGCSVHILVKHNNRSGFRFDGNKMEL